MPPEHTRPVIDDAETAPPDIPAAELERVLNEVPRGALALCGIAVALLLLAWLGMYFGVFLPRGPVN